MKIQSYIVPITFNALDSQETLSPQISLYSPYLYNNNNNNNNINNNNNNNNNNLNALNNDYVTRRSKLKIRLYSHQQS